MRLRYLHMTLQQRDNHCARGHQTLQDRGRKKVTSHSKFNATVLIVSDIQSGYPVARLPINTIILKSWLKCRNKWEGNGQDCEEMGRFCIRKMRQPITLVCKAVSRSVLAHPPYLLDLAPCDFFLFPKLKSTLIGANFLSVEEVKAKTIKLLNSLRENNLQHCFEQWQHCMQLCLNSEGNHKWFFELCK